MELFRRNIMLMGGMCLCGVDKATAVISQYGERVQRPQPMRDADEPTTMLLSKKFGMTLRLLRALCLRINPKKFGKTLAGKILGNWDLSDKLRF